MGSKTSTGFAPSDATLDDLRLMRSNVSACAATILDDFKRLKESGVLKQVLMPKQLKTNLFK